MGEYKAAVRLVGLRHAKKGSTIAEALETIGLLLLLRRDRLHNTPHIDLPSMEGCMEAMLSASLYLHHCPPGRYRDVQAPGDECGATWG
jgi:hypothetical protein